MTAREWLDKALERIEEEKRAIIRSELELLIEGIAGIDRLDLYLEKSQLSGKYFDQLERGLSDRIDGRPLQHILGKVNFAGLDIKVDARVLIPRPETEWIVHRILEIEDKGVPFNILDIGTGSGCIALALKKSAPEWSVSGLDLSADALSLAHYNATNNDLNVQFLAGDITLLDDIAGEYSFDIIVSNPPYIPLSEKPELQPEVRDYDPGMALFCNDDPLKFYRCLSHHGKMKLKNGGRIYLECHEDFASDVANHLEETGYRRIETELDLNGKPRLVKARWPN